MRLLNRDGLLAPDRSLKRLMKQRQSRRNRGRGDRALRKPRHNLSPFRRRPPKLNREPSSVIKVYRSKDLRLSTRCSRSIGAANSRSRKVRQHLPTMGTLFPD